jgi:hypothetical protein
MSEYLILKIGIFIMLWTIFFTPIFFFAICVYYAQELKKNNNAPQPIPFITLPKDTASLISIAIICFFLQICVVYAFFYIKLIAPF